MFSLITFLDPTIAKVFASLNDVEENVNSNVEAVKSKSKIDLDEIIANAKTVNGLLSIAETQSEISRKHALKVGSLYSCVIFETIWIF
jgi:hypothetical protein